MRKTTVFLAVIIAVIMAPCMAFAQSDRISVWSFTDEVEQIIDKYYKQANPNASISYNLIPTDQFTNRLDSVLASGRGAPDVFALEAYFVRKYVESGLLMDLTDIYNANKDRLMAFPVEVGTYEGRVYALSWQACPGAMFYRRSLAKKYLGTDDPAVVQKHFENFDKFIETARLLNQKSNGSCVVVPSRDDISLPFYGARKQPWVVNGRLVLDPMMDKYMDIAKEMYDNNYEGRVAQWSDAWFSGFNDRLHNQYGNPVEVFAYFFPPWGLQYVMKPNGGRTAGDWAMIQGPSAWRWGGTWIAAYKGAQNADAVKEFIRYVATNEEFQQRWAQDIGDMVTNINSVNKVRDRFSEPYIGGQNHYAEFARYAERVNGKLDQATDNVIQAIFEEQVTAFVYGEKTKPQALADFRTDVREQLGIR